MSAKNPSVSTSALAKLFNLTSVRINPSDIKKEQLRRMKEEADKLELQNSRTRGELVLVAKVKRMGEQVMSAIKTKILNMPLTDDEKDKCLRDLLSLSDLDFSDD